MKESDLYRLRVDPPPEFQRRLRMALKAQEAAIPAESAAARKSVRAMTLTALAAVVATAMLMLSVPSMRAGAEALREFLGLRNCAAATMDRDRFNRLCHRPS
jgi:hypothetical protein